MIHNQIHRAYSSQFLIFFNDFFFQKLEFNLRGVDNDVKNYKSVSRYIRHVIQIIGP